MCVPGEVGGSGLSSVPRCLVEFCHPTPPWGAWERRGSPVPAGWWLCPSRVCLVGAWPSSPCSPRPPRWLWEPAAPSLRQREGWWEPLAVPRGLFLGRNWHGEPRFYPRDPSPSAGRRVQISPTPSPAPPSFHPSPCTSLSSHPRCGCCPAPQPSAPHQPGLSACCP